MSHLLLIIFIAFYGKLPLPVKVFHALILTVKPLNYMFTFDQAQGRRKLRKWTMFLGMRYFGQRSGIFVHVADLSQHHSLVILAGWKRGT